jgi:hypothetical protein
MNRRSILKVGATILGAGSVGYGGLLLTGASRACEGQGVTGPGHGEALAHVGESYLRNVASAGERAELTAMLEEVARNPEGDLAETIWQVATRLAGSSKQDFRKGDTVKCDGWILARGEGRACALLALAKAWFPLVGLRL